MPPVLIGAAVGAIAAGLSGAIGLTALTLGSVLLGAALGGLQGLASLITSRAPSFEQSITDRTIMVRAPIQPRRLVAGRSKVSGTLIFLHSNGDGNKFLHMIVALSGGEVAAIGDIFLNDNRVSLDAAGDATGASKADGTSDTDYTGLVRVKKYLGTSSQAADPDLTAEADGKWTTAHRLRETAYVYVRLTYDQDVFTAGVPNVAAIVDGMMPFDPRTGASAWTRNPSLLIRAYLMDARYGLAADADEIDEDSFIAAANISDEAVPLAAGGTEPRYTCDGTIETNQTPKDIIEGLLTACAGSLVYTGGKWRLLAGAWRTPEPVAITAGDLRRPVKIQPRQSLRSSFNAVKGTFVAPENDYQPADYPAITSSTYEAEDGGDRVFKDLTLPFTDSASMAQRIAKIDLRRARQPISIALPCKLHALRYAVGDVVPVSLSRFGWAGKLFEVRNWAFAIEDGAIGVDLDLRETASAVFDWSQSEEKIFDPAPATNLPKGSSVATPAALALESGDAQLFVAGDGTVVSQMLATWTPGADVFVSQFEVQWKRNDAADYKNGALVSGVNTSQIISPVEDGAGYDVRVRAVNSFGVRSAWLTVENHIVVGKTAPPPNVENFDISAMADGTRRFSWSTANMPADVRAGGGYRIRFALGFGVVDWEAVTDLHDGIVVTTPFETNELASGAYSFAIKAVDSSGNLSATASFIEATLPNPRLASALFEQNEVLAGFPGTKTNAFVDGPNGPLRATSTGNWNSLAASWSALPGTWDQIVAQNGTIVYETQEFDLGSDTTFRPLVTIDAVGAVTVEMKTGTAADGGVVGSYGAITTVTARYLKIRVTVVSAAAPAILGMQTIIDAPAGIELFLDINTATETGSWFARIAAGHIKIASRGGISAISIARVTALQNVGAGWSWELISKTATIGSQPAAEFKIYNAAATLADAVADIELRGARAT